MEVKSFQDASVGREGRQGIVARFRCHIAFPGHSIQILDAALPISHLVIVLEIIALSIDSGISGKSEQYASRPLPDLGS